MDDLLISHVNITAINKFLQELKAIYGNSLTESIGKQHDYLGMIFDFSSKNEVQINMTQYVSKIIEDFPEEIGGKSSPAGDHLFKTREDGRKLDNEMADAFHHTVYQLLFAANCAHREIQTAVSFSASK